MFILTVSERGGGGCRRIDLCAGVKLLVKHLHTHCFKLAGCVVVNMKTKHIN